MRKILLSGAALGLFSIMPVPASAMPVAQIAPAITADETAAVQVHYRRYYSRYSYRPRARYAYRNYDYDGGYPVRRSYGYGGGPSYYGGGARASDSASAAAAGNFLIEKKGRSSSALFPCVWADDSTNAICGNDPP